MKSRATLKNISGLLNISISTVSRALKNHPDISQETRQKVKELAAMLDYEPNPYAINLRTNGSRMIGVIVPAISNLFYHSFIAEVEELARKNGYSLLVLQSNDDPATELENLRLCRLNRVAGVLVAITSGTHDISPFLKLEENGTPVIFFDKVPAFDACNKVCLADVEAANLAAEAVIQKHRKSVFAIFGNRELSITKKRLDAFQRHFFPGPGIPSLKISFANSHHEAYAQTKQAFEHKPIPDTLFCMSDEILMGVMKALMVLQIPIPSKAAVIAISNGFIPTLYFPEITYVETSGLQLGQLTFRRFLDFLEGKTFARELIVPSRLVEGGSL